jgi:DNA-binding XRE family transcriptional regulator
MANRSKVKGSLVSPVGTDANELARRLKVARTARGLSQDDVAREFAINARSVSQWEMAKAMPKAAKIARLAELYGVPAEWLWGKGEIPKDLPNVQRVSRKLRDALVHGKITTGVSPSVFVSHRRNMEWDLVKRRLGTFRDALYRDEFSGLPVDDELPEIPVIDKIPPGNIASLHQVATMRTGRLLPQILTDLRVAPEHAVILKIHEDTNEPDIRRGALIVVDTAANEFRGSRNYYIFNLYGQLNLIRRVSPEHSRGKLGFLLAAGNDAVTTMLIEPSDNIQILGRVAGVLNPL